MLRTLSLLLALSVAGTAALAQTAAAGSIQATGTASLNVQPDQVQLSVSVVTQADTAAQAGQQNAAQTNAMIASLNQVLGKSGTLQTSGYSIYPRYSSVPGQASTIAGYTAQNTLLVTAYDLTLAGPLIDTANTRHQSGASSVSGLTFGLQDSEPARLQALTQAGKIAQSHAAAIAAGLGAKAGPVLSAVEGGSGTIAPVLSGVGASSSTPVISGTVTVSATVTITVQLLQ